MQKKFIFTVKCYISVAKIATKPTTHNPKSTPVKNTQLYQQNHQTIPVKNTKLHQQKSPKQQAILYIFFEPFLFSSKSAIEIIR